MRISLRSLTFAAMIASLYVLLTCVSMTFGLHQGMIQIRLSEMLSVLPIFASSAIPGLTVGCLLANLLTGASVLDVFFGTLATLLGGIGTRLLRKYPLLASFVPVLSNALIVPLVLRYAYHSEELYLVMLCTVGLGEMVMCMGLGTFLRRFLTKHPWMLPMSEK